MHRRLLVLGLLILMAMPLALPGGSVKDASAQPQTTQQEFNNLLPYNYYNATSITISSPAIIGYASRSNVTIYTAFMDQSQLNALNSPSQIENAVFVQEGMANYDALLELPGTYYLVTYNPTQGETANVTALYIIDSNVDLRNSTTSVALTVNIQPGAILTIPLHAETVGSNSTVDILGASSQVVQYSLQERNNPTPVFISPFVTITNFTVYPTVSIGYNLTLSPGLYFVSIQDESANPVVVYFQYDLTPAYVNPFIVNTGSPWPTGLGAFGIYNYSGKVVPYKLDTSSVIGFAGISRLKATDNQSGAADASLQENAVLQVNNTDGSLFTYWPQNVLAFDTGSSQVTYRDNVLNTTGDGAQLTNQSITGTGITSLDNNNGVLQTYYGNYNSTYTFSYTLPQSFVMYMNETAEQGQGVLIQMGVRALNGPHPSSITWYDNITIVDPNVASAAFVVDGKSYTPAGAASIIGSYYDAELVFGGGAGGQAATFQINARLGLFYWANGVVPFRSLYTFGDDTAEAAYNIKVSNGTQAASVTAGAPYYGLLTNDYNGSLATLITQGENLGAGFGTGLLVAVVVIAAIVVIGLAVLLRRRTAHAQPVLLPTSGQLTSSFCGVCGTQLEPGGRFCPNCGAEQQPEPAASAGPP